MLEVNSQKVGAETLNLKILKIFEDQAEDTGEFVDAYSVVCQLVYRVVISVVGYI
jgi:hypothetical protein